MSTTKKQLCTAKKLKKLNEMKFIFYLQKTLASNKELIISMLHNFNIITAAQQIANMALAAILSPETKARIVNEREQLLQKANLPANQFALELYKVINANYIPPTDEEKNNLKRNLEPDYDSDDGDGKRQNVG